MVFFLPFVEFIYNDDEYVHIESLPILDDKPYKDLKDYKSIGTIAIVHALEIGRKGGLWPFGRKVKSYRHS